MREHIHPGHRTAIGPDMTIHHPLLVLRPLDVRAIGRYPIIFNIVDRGVLAVKNPSRRKSCSAGTRGIDNLPGCNMASNEVDVLWRELEFFWYGSTNQEIVQVWAIVHGVGMNGSDGACQQWKRIKVLTNMVEYELRGSVDCFLLDRFMAFSLLTLNQSRHDGASSDAVLNAPICHASRLVARTR